MLLKLENLKKNCCTGASTLVVLGSASMMNNIRRYADVGRGVSDSFYPTSAGMPTWAAAFLIPIVSCLPYTLMGGLKATFLAHYFNTFFIFLALFLFMFAGFLFGDGATYGTPGKVLDALDATSRYTTIARP